MRVVPVDPRDTEWEQDQAVFRVFVWSPLGTGWASDGYDVYDADVAEVLRWIEGRMVSGGRFTVFVRTERNGSPGLIRIAGWEPVRPDAPPSWVDDGRTRGAP